MHFSKREQYALLFMGELARRNGARISLREISSRHGVSVPFLKAIVRPLREAGLVQSKEGVGGGYVLVRTPKDIALWDILSPFDRRGKPATSICPLNTSCLPQHIRARLTESMKEQLSRISLQDAI